MEEFVRQFRVLAWKNCKLKLRASTVLVMEMLIPILIVFALGSIKNAIAPTIVGDILAQNVFTEGTSNGLTWNLANQRICGSRSLFWECGGRNADCDPLTQQNIPNEAKAQSELYCQERKIAVAPKSYSTSSAQYLAASEFVTWANSEYQLNADGYTRTSEFVLFSDESAFLNLLDTKSYSFTGDIYSSAVIFDGGYPSWDYTVRFNKTLSSYGARFYYPATSDPDLNNQVRSPEDFPEVGFGNSQPFYYGWVENGYVPLTNAINKFITTKTCRTGGTCSSLETFNYEMKSSQPFPSAKYETTGFWAALGADIFPLFMIIVLLYPLSNVISVLVKEKESKLREGMKMMSLKSGALWLSWWFNFMCLFFPLAILLTLVGQTLFEFSAPIYIFLYFFVFFLSSTSYCIFISTFFTNSRTASIVGSLGFFAGYFIYVGVGSANVARANLIMASLHPATAFTYACLSFTEYEDNAQGVTDFTWNVSNDNNITFKDCLDMMFVDAIYLLFLAWYVDKIWPSEFGTQEKWYFLFTPKYWKNMFGMTVFGTAANTREIHSAQHGEVSMNGVNVELVSESLMSQFENKTCVDIQNLRKEFETPQGVKKVAVNGLNLTMFQGHITALLGHNGAGKTTAIAMLTGLIPPDDGTAVIEGYDIHENMDEIRKNLGVCPQHDILFAELTVEEHLIMFCSFKGVSGQQMNDEVEKMIQSVGLTEKRHIRSRLLSGGQKRKLSVGIAFIGGSRVVFLDEPTSGMDPYSRRFTWNVIRNHREGRVVVLTTHFMDEADLLGDRIAIMGDGKLCCCGSSLYLKRMYGVGYNMTLEKKNATTFNSKKMITKVTNEISEATLLTDVGTEMTFQLPFNASPKFPTLFDHIDSNFEELGLASYGISVTTLEEVFIKITRSTHTNTEAQKGIDIAKINGKSSMSEETDTLVISSDAAEKQKVGIMHDFEKIPEDNQYEYFIQHMKALFIKRGLYFIRDRKAWVFTFLVPFVFLLVGLIIMANTYPSTYDPSKIMATTMYNPKVSSASRLPTPFVNERELSYTQCSVNFPAFCAAAYSTVRSDSNVAASLDIIGNFSLGSSFPFEDVSMGSTLPLSSSASNAVSNMSTYLFNNMNAQESMRVGGYVFDSTTNREMSFIAYTNYSAVYAVPLYQTLMVDATVRSINPTASVTSRFFPLPPTKNQDDFYSNYNVDLVVTFIMLAIPFVPAAFITYIVREKEVKAKHQQMVSGVGVVAYWLSTFIWDNLTFLFTVCLFAVLVAGPVFGEETKPLGGGGEAYGVELGCFFGMMFLFGTSMTGFTYLLSYAFKTPATAQVCMIFVCFILGLALSIVGIVLRILPDTRDDYNLYIRYLLSVFPPFALGDGLHNMALINVWSAYENGGIQYDPRDWEITGMSMMMMGWETVVFLAGTILFELITAMPSIQKFADSLLGDLPVTDEALKDCDVIAEEKRVESGLADESTILVKGLKKQYAGGKYAVKGVSIGIPNGEVFGLLGINGAGKSSTLSMLSGEFAPSSGDATLAGLDLLTDIHKCRRKIGFCPQFDALFELLTAREHLDLYARIKGIEEQYIEAVVDAKINEMGLTEYADRYAGTYSGGNKRKLSVAIAMIGEPSIVFLDEPSTGMDPVARRFMWDVISDIVTTREKCSLILTTHSMEECEALCTRIGIMVGGVLRCLGSAQRLRNKYGNGFQIEFGFEIPNHENIESKRAEILGLLSLPYEKDSETDETLTRDQLDILFTKMNKKDAWSPRMTSSGNGADLVSAFETYKCAGLKHICSWVILEEVFDNTCAFMRKEFDNFTVHERQPTKLRVEIDALDNNTGKRRLLGKMFGTVEANKDKLKIQDYSISQTSLEQIFNFFAAQQEEETGDAGALGGGESPAIETSLFQPVATTEKSVAETEMTPVTQGNV